MRRIAFLCMVLVCCFVSLSFASVNAEKPGYPRDISDVLDEGEIWLPPNVVGQNVRIHLHNDTAATFRIDLPRGEERWVRPGDDITVRVRNTKEFLTLRQVSDPASIRNYRISIQR